MQMLTDQDAARELGLQEYGLMPAKAGHVPVLADAQAQRPLDNIVSVADNGRGIDAGDRQRAVEPLVRLNRPGDGPGSGLGLATCRRIATAHGGELLISDTPGGGATISMLIAT